MFALESFHKTKKGVKTKTSDHNSILCTFKFKWNKHINKQRNVHFNLKNVEGLKRFKEITSKNILSVVNKDSDINNLTKEFIKRLNGIIQNCFKKIRIKEDSGVSDVTMLLDKRRILRCKSEIESNRELEAVETELADKYAECNYRI